jgi:mobilization protein NikA
MLSSRRRWERARVAHGEPYETQPLSPPPAPCCRCKRSTGGVRPESPSHLRRCSLKPPLRTKSVGTKVSEAEFALLEERARGAGMRLGEWVREALLSAPAESGPDSGEVALAEVLALRSLLLNLHFRSATILEAEMRGLIERADGSKLERPWERIAAVRATTRAALPEPETTSEAEPEEV